ncbi:GNAT family N-acetyltransferase [bacterium]|nr:GNAT family N-acetyltransferase [bacterium]
MTISSLNHLEFTPPGVVLRPATLDDCAALAEMLNASSQALSGTNEFSEQGLRSEFTQPGFDLSQSSMIAILNGRIVGYSDIWDIPTPPIKPYVFGRVDPEFEGQGIGTALLAWAEERSRKAIVRVPDGARVAMVAATGTRHTSSMQLLGDYGMVATRYSFEMSIDLTESSFDAGWPEGLTLTTLAGFGNVRSVYDAYRDAWQDHRGWVAQDEEAAFPAWLHRMTTAPEHDPSLWFVALDGKEVAGVLFAKRLIDEDPDLGWVDNLAVRRPWRRRGLGKALILTAFAEFARRGFKRGGLGVDAHSLTGATRLYEQLGMHVKDEHTIFEKELRPGIDLSKQSIDGA